MTIQWGSVSDWFSGVSTAIAVIVALVFSIRSEKLSDEQRLAAVYAWFLIVPTVNGPRGQLWLKNSTEMPIYQWKVRVEWSASGNSSKNLSIGSDSAGVLRPGEFSFDLSPTHELPNNDSAFKVDLYFTDSRGRRLNRTPIGILSPDKRKRGEEA